MVVMIKAYEQAFSQYEMFLSHDCFSFQLYHTAYQNTVLKQVSTTCS